MYNLQIVLVCCCIALISFFYGKSRIIKLAAGLNQRPNSLPIFYGVYPALLGLILPALLAGLWLFLETILLDRMLLSLIPEDILSSDAFSASVALARIHNLADGISVGEVDSWITELAEQYLEWKRDSYLMMSVLTILISGIACIYALGKIQIIFRARAAVEKIISTFLIVCSVVAILTTIGIVFSVIFRINQVFPAYPAARISDRPDMGSGI